MGKRDRDRDRDLEPPRMINYGFVRIQLLVHTCTHTHTHTYSLTFIRNSLLVMSPSLAFACFMSSQAQYRRQLTCRKIFQLSLFWCVTAVRATMNNNKNNIEKRREEWHNSHRPSLTTVVVVAVVVAAVAVVVVAFVGAVSAVKNAKIKQHSLQSRSPSLALSSVCSSGFGCCLLCNVKSTF